MRCFDSWIILKFITVITTNSNTASIDFSELSGSINGPAHTHNDHKMPIAHSVNKFSCQSIKNNDVSCQVADAGNCARNLLRWLEFKWFVFCQAGILPRKAKDEIDCQWNVISIQFAWYQKESISHYRSKFKCFLSLVLEAHFDCKLFLHWEIHSLF